MVQRNSVRKKRAKSHTAIVAAFLHASGSIAVGYVLLGPLPSGLFAVPFMGGFVAWLLMGKTPPFSAIKIPYFAAWAFFILHKIEEREFGFFPKLAQITGTPAPDENSPWVWALYLLSAAWLLIPSWTKRDAPYGYYLARTFFLALGVVELAHFIFPLMTGKPYGYFPGMATAAPLAAAGLWGAWRLARTGKPSNLTKQRQRS